MKPLVKVFCRSSRDELSYRYKVKYFCFYLLNYDSTREDPVRSKSTKTEQERQNGGIAFDEVNVNANVELLH